MNERYSKMSVKTKSELLEMIKNRIGDGNSDEDISFIEDITDTVNDLENKASNNINWEQKYNENDAAWRKKYRDRFFNTDVDDIDEPPIEEPKQYSYENLFK